MLFILLLIIGFIGGILAGLLGVGGGLIFTPVLFLLFDGNVDQPVIWTIATSLLCTFFAALGSVRKHYSMNNLFIQESLKVALFGVFGTQIGKQITLSPWYSRTHFVLLFSSLLAYTSIIFFKGKKEAPVSTIYNPKNTLPVHWQAAALAGGAGGILATLAGVGGGIIMVPILTIAFGIHFRKAVSISSFVIVFISLSAWILYSLEVPVSSGLSSFTKGFVDFGTGLPLIIGALLGSGTGVWLTGKIQKRKLELIFAILALIIIVRLISGLF